MSAQTQYQVLYIDDDGAEQLTGAMSHEQASTRARDLHARGYTVGAVMDVESARSYMQDRYAAEYRGVKVPDGIRDDGVARGLYASWKRGVDAALDAVGVDTA